MSYNFRVFDTFSNTQDFFKNPFKKLPNYKTEVWDKHIFALELQEILDNQFISTSSSSYRSGLSSRVMSAAYESQINALEWPDLESSVNFRNQITMTYRSTEVVHPYPSRRVMDDWVSDINNSRRLSDDD